MDLIPVLVVIIIAVAFFGEAIFGFGGGLIAIPLLSLILGVRDAVILVLIFQVLIGLLMIRSYRHIDWRAAKPMTASLLLGTIVGMWLLSQASVVFLQVFLALAIMVFCLR